MNLIKDDLQFILDNKSRAKLKEKLLENSFNNYNHSNLISDSDLNCSVVSTHGKIKSRYNLKEKMDNKNLTKFQEFLNTYNQNKNVLLLVDSKNYVWELVKRTDLSIANLSTMENITSMNSGLNFNNFIRDDNYLSSGGKNNNNCNFIDEKLLNIEIKENDDKSFANSELDISKVTDFNISAMIRDTQNYDNISDTK
jgi:hypothetical protein